MLHYGCAELRLCLHADVYCVQWLGAGCYCRCMVHEATELIGILYLDLTGFNTHQAT